MFLQGAGMRFKDRTVAGKQLAARLGAYRKRPDVLVLALPRGGVPVAAEVGVRHPRTRANPVSHAQLVDVTTAPQ